jgi:hypothetical protein
MAMFFRGMVGVVEVNVERIIEDGAGLFEGDSMLPD